MSLNRWWPQQILPFLGPELGPLLKIMPRRVLSGVREIRLRIGFPPCVVSDNGSFLWGTGETPGNGNARIVTPADIDGILERMCRGSVYTREREFREGFLTLPGGHRVGMAGRILSDSGKIRITPQLVTSLNIRVAREVKGAARELFQRLWESGMESTIIFSPPGAGKTTMLRDLTRELGSRIQVGVVDERGELAGSDSGGHRLDLGPMTDVLEYCPKATGLMWLIRSMGPQVVVTDELGGAEDAAAVLEAVQAGVSVMATAHGRSTSELASRPGLGPLLGSGCFSWLVRLGFSRGVGTVEQIERWERVVGGETAGGSGSGDGRYISRAVGGGEAAPAAPGSGAAGGRP